MLRGGCHCGNISIALETRLAPADLPLRECGCSFCRMHAARTTADPAGRARIVIRDAAEVSRYRWNLGTAEFLVCRRCGAYAGAVLREGPLAWATLNTRLLEDQAPFRREAQPVSYESETAEQRIARRKLQWTPADVGQVGRGRSRTVGARGERRPSTGPPRRPPRP